MPIKTMATIKLIKTLTFFLAKYTTCLNHMERVPQESKNIGIWTQYHQGTVHSPEKNI
jgi:hypothetical protein